MRTSIIAVLSVLAFTASAQLNVQSIHPSSVVPLDLSETEAKKFNEIQKAANIIYQKLGGGMTREQLTPEERKIYDNFDDSKDDYWQTEGNGCSWYCGGGPNRVTASSALRTQGDNSYNADNAHDFSYKTAWVEGVPGYGIGEFIEFEFLAESPRLNKIIITNGYVKSATAWENNSRVKKLRMYVNNKPVAILNLVDKRASQAFDVNPIGTANRNDYEAMAKLPPWKLKFEILEVYKGSKYDDVAITEISFDGLDVHCFAKGTQVSMADGTTKSIEKLVKGDKVLTFDEAEMKYKPAIVEGTASASHHNLVRYLFENGNQVIATQDHPFLIRKKGWASSHPAGSHQYIRFFNIGTISVNDEFLSMLDSGGIGYSRLVSMEILRGHQDTFTITKLDNGNNFIANGMTVGTEETASLQ